MALEVHKFTIHPVAADPEGGWVWRTRDGRESKVVFRTTKEAMRAGKRATRNK